MNSWSFFLRLSLSSFKALRHLLVIQWRLGSTLVFYVRTIGTTNFEEQHSYSSRER